MIVVRTPVSDTTENHYNFVVAQPLVSYHRGCSINICISKVVELLLFFILIVLIIFFAKVFGLLTLVVRMKFRGHPY